MILLLLALQTETLIETEVAPERVERPDGLGTAGYEPREKEKPFVEKLSKEERSNGSLFEDYTILGKKGTAVAWFGVVRGVAAVKDGYELTVQHQFFDGMTDTHILALSCFGDGDFKVRVRCKAPPVDRTLALVRVYGTVAEETDGVPVVEAEYVRVFPWKTFTYLMAYGKDRTNPEWKKLRTVSDDDIYDPAPDEKYYLDRLGKPEEVKKP